MFGGVGAGQPSLAKHVGTLCLPDDLVPLWEKEGCESVRPQHGVVMGRARVGGIAWQSAPPGLGCRGLWEGPIPHREAGEALRGPLP